MEGGGNSLSLIKDINKMREAQIFSFEERCIGTWVDGKPLYRKMIDFGTLPANDFKSVVVEIDNVRHQHINLGESMWLASAQSYSSTATIYTFIYCTYIERVYVSINSSSKKVIDIKTNNVDAEKYKALICYEYTKSTDY